MVALKVERIGDKLAVVLTQQALKELNVGAGDTVRLEAAEPAAAREGWMDDPHARGRAFLKRYNRDLDRLG